MALLGRVVLFLLALVALCALGADARLRQGQNNDPRLYKAQHSFRAPFYIGMPRFWAIFLLFDEIKSISIIICPF